MTKIFLWSYLMSGGEGRLLRNDCLKFCMFTYLLLKWIFLYEVANIKCFKTLILSNSWFLSVLTISLPLCQVDVTQMPCCALHRAKRVLLRDGDSDSEYKQTQPLSQTAGPQSINRMLNTVPLSVMSVTQPEFFISSWSLRIRESLKSHREWRSLEDPSAHFERSQYFCKTQYFQCETVMETFNIWIAMSDLLFDRW